MKITIHRGIDQIGGCITEIATDRTRILIDLGQNLPDGEGVIHDGLASREAVERLTRGVDAIFYTHYHGDHIGLFHLVPDSVPQYMGGVAMMVTIQKHLRLSMLPELFEENERAVRKVAAMRSFEAKDRIEVGDITVTPYFVSHSACDAYMFLIEAGGKRILHTGDFRGHGYLSKGTIPTIEKYILRDGAVDFLITEGTMLSRTGERVATEAELGRQIEEVMRRYKYVFAMCSSNAAPGCVQIVCNKKKKGLRFSS
jgi:ribonuclease J